MKVLSYFIILISAFLLQGCITAAVVGTAAVGTKVVTDPRTIGTQIDDVTLKLRIHNAISKDEEIKKKARIKVITYQRKVLMVGQAPIIDLALRAQQIAMRINGVSEIFNEVRHQNPIGFSTIISDIWITTKIRFQFLESNRVKSSNIKVMTENSEVFLLGLVTEREEKIAANIVSRVIGVKHVIIGFTHIQ